MLKTKVLCYDFVWHNPWIGPSKSFLKVKLQEKVVLLETYSPVIKVLERGIKPVYHKLAGMKGAHWFLLYAWCKAHRKFIALQAVGFLSQSLRLWRASAAE